MTAVSLAPQGVRTVLRFWGLALLGSAALAASAQVAVPMWPVPATMQTLVVLLLGAFGGARFGVTAVALYIAEGAAGLPVFAHGTGGLAVLAGPTAGYLAGFLAGAWAAGHAGRGWLRAGAVLTMAHLMVFVPGIAWLAGFVGIERAIAAGFVPFIPGLVVKTALALVLLRAARRV